MRRPNNKKRDVFRKSMKVEVGNSLNLFFILINKFLVEAYE
ncbi:MAG: hypothetical protein RIQ61_832 [Bacteroidota bacterium]|jgi:hypothetical protein